ncbi:MAG: DegT/DnrJ/EryC1/StrS family aminotransferase [bacterium]|nr:DegT/DnrJ/EryC1/StrS family aminotransferase [bacterium]
MKQIKFFTLEKQNKLIGKKIKKALSRVVDSGIYVNGPETRKFEEEWSKINGCKYTVFCGSGTAALEIALKCVGVRSGDKVLTTANSFLASTSCILSAGAVPDWVDTDENAQISIWDLEQKLNSEYAAILPVNLYGFNCDLDKIQMLSKKFRVPVVLDAAQAHFCNYKGNPLTDFADIVCTSFYVSKSLGSYGESGAIMTNNEDLYKLALSFRNHGRDEEGYSHNRIYGNGRGDEFQAAILLEKLKIKSHIIENKLRIQKLYYKNLKHQNLIHPDAGSLIINYVFPVFVPEDERGYIIESMKSKGIQLMIHYPQSIPSLRCFSHLSLPNDFLRSNKQCSTEISLPSYPELTDSEINYISENLANLLPKIY